MNASEGQGVSRRGFLRAATSVLCGAATVAKVSTQLYVINELVSCAGSITDSAPSGPAAPIGKDEIGTRPREQYLIERTVGDVTYRLHGVEHSREYASENYRALEALVRGSDVVVPEYGPEAPEVIERASYFATIKALATEHGKPLVGMNVQSRVGRYADTALGIAGAVTATIGSKGLKSGDRRDFLKNAAITCAGIYGWLGSMAGIVPLGIPLVMGLREEWGVKGFNADPALIGHIRDHRNVHYADRLLRLPELMPELKDGGNILVTTGAAHTASIAFYLSHPHALALKKTLYAGTLDPLGKHRIVIWRPVEAGIYTEQEFDA